MTFSVMSIDYLLAFGASEAQTGIIKACFQDFSAHSLTEKPDGDH